MELQSFYSRGKLLITGEYLVMNGAEALAVPVNFGQTLVVKPLSKQSFMSWKTYVLGQIWQETTFKTPDLEIDSTSNDAASLFLQALLKNAKTLNPLLDFRQSYELVSDLDFDIEWGLGSSSSLISNVAYWAKVDPFQLRSLVAKGSGYDVACARAYTPILYRLIDGVPVIREVAYKPPFSKHLFFVYLGHKQHTAKVVNTFLAQTHNYNNVVSQINSITHKTLDCKDILEFGELMNEHEQIIAGILNQVPIKKRFFEGFKGEIKSLGAWGGDFVMVLWPEERNMLENYMKERGFSVILSYDEMVYQQYL